MSLPPPGVVAELVRLPAVLSVPGDVLLGAAVSGRARDVGRTAGLTCGSCCLYLAGMALNDYADRDADALTRPHRPIPSGRVSPGFALGLASALTVAGGALALAAGGRDAAFVACPLVAVVWAYDLLLKEGAVATPGMASCRGLDVLVGAGAQGAARALPAATLVAGHTAMVTEVSRHEEQGASPALPLGGLLATAAVASAALRLTAGASAGRRAFAAGLLGAYTAAVAPAQALAARDPSPERLQAIVAAGILGLIPLEAALVVPAHPARGACLAALWPLARSLSRRRSVT